MVHFKRLQHTQAPPLTTTPQALLLTTALCSSTAHATSQPRTLQCTSTTHTLASYYRHNCNHALPLRLHTSILQFMPLASPHARTAACGCPQTDSSSKRRLACDALLQIHYTCHTHSKHPTSSICSMHLLICSVLCCCCVASAMLQSIPRRSCHGMEQHSTARLQAARMGQQVEQQQQHA